MPLSTLQLRPPRNLVSRKAIVFWTVRALIGWVVLGAVQAWFLYSPGDHLTLRWSVLAGTAVLAAAHLTVMPRWRYRIHRWEVTPHAVYTQSGWFNQQRRIAPVSRIQTVDSERGPVEQLFGLTNVTITTASAAGPLKIHGLANADALALVDELLANTSTDDAT